MRRHLKALFAAGILSVLTGLMIAYDYHTSRTFDPTLMGFNCIVIGLALVLIAISGDKDDKRTKK